MPDDSPLSPPFPSFGRLLGIDFGTKRLGFAICNDEQTIASPLVNRVRESRAQDEQFLRKLSRVYDVVGIVVGLPVHMSGQEGGKAREARKFGEWAAEVASLPLRFHDERYTSVIAESHLMAANLSPKQRKARLDMVAAQVLLQSFLNAADRDLPPGDLTDER